MPELPEVEVVLQHLKPQILGATIETLAIHRSDQATISKVHRMGKCVVMTCQRSQKTRYLLSELGMTGLWFFKATLASSPQHIHCHITLSGRKIRELHYWNPRRFGRLWLFEPSGLEAFIQRRFGPDALAIKEAPFCELIQTTRGQLKPLLLNQHRLAGIGNIYANEMLFRANIHPYAQGHQLRLTSRQRLHRTMQEVLREAIAAGALRMALRGTFRRHTRSIKRTACLAHMAAQPSLNVYRKNAVHSSAHLVKRSAERK
jgi:formamidopyrimidine-DNA glycosylase